MKGDSMKKLFVCLTALMLALTLCLALCSCGSKPVQIDSDKQDDTEPVKPVDTDPADDPADEPTDEPSEDGEQDEEPEPIPVDDEPTPVPVDKEPEPIAPADDDTDEEPEKHDIPEDDPPELPDTDIKGRLTSEQSKGLKLVVDWAYVADTGKVAAIVSLRSYSIHVKAKPLSGSVTVGESTQSFSTPELINEENEAKTFYVAELEFDAPDSTSIPISALWNFGGTYSGAAIEALTVEGTIELA